MRQRRSADARNSGEPRPQVLVERENLRITVTGLPGIQFEQQHVFAIEAHLDGLQVGKRPHEKSGPGNENYGQDDLQHHQRLAQAYTPEGHARPHTRFGCPACFKRRYDIGTRQLNRGRKAKRGTA